MVTRIYLVRSDSGPERLVRAANRAQAINFVARKTYKASIAKQDELIEAVTANVEIELAAPEEEEGETDNSTLADGEFE